MTARYDGTQFTINLEQFATADVAALVTRYADPLYPVAKSFYPAQSYTPGEVIATDEDKADVLNSLSIRFQKVVGWLHATLTSPTIFILPIPGTVLHLVTVFNTTGPAGPFPHWSEFLDLLTAVEEVPSFGTDLGLLGFGIHLPKTPQN